MRRTRGKTLQFFRFEISRNCERTPFVLEQRRKIKKIRKFLVGSELHRRTRSSSGKSERRSEGKCLRRTEWRLFIREVMTEGTVSTTKLGLYNSASQHPSYSALWRGASINLLRNDGVFRVSVYRQEFGLKPRCSSSAVCEGDFRRDKRL